MIRIYDKDKTGLYARTQLNNSAGKYIRRFLVIQKEYRRCKVQRLSSLMIYVSNRSIKITTTTAAEKRTTVIRWFVNKPTLIYHFSTNEQKLPAKCILHWSKSFSSWDTNGNMKKIVSYAMICKTSSSMKLNYLKSCS